MSPSQIVIYSRWIGFASPPFHAAKLTIENVDGHWICVHDPDDLRDEVPSKSVDEFLSCLARPPIKELDASMFDMPEAAIRGDYASMWTDDDPSHLIRVRFANGRTLEILADSQHAFMLPLKMRDSGGEFYETFDPTISRAIAKLMPDGYLEKDRLSGKLALLQHGAGVTFLVTEPEPSSNAQLESASLAPREVCSLPSPRPDPASFEAMHDEILRILFREESPKEREAAEKSGDISPRLLKRVSAEDVRDLIARGANVNIADDAGQTALMVASWPPFDREKFRLLVEAGATIDACRNDGCTGLHCSCAGGESAAAAEWVRAGADVNVRTPDGETPLILAARWPRIVETLLDAGAQINTVDQDGHSALAAAIILQCWVSAADTIESLRLLLAANADVNFRDRPNISPLGHSLRVLKRVRLEDEVRRAFNPDADFKLDDAWTEEQLAKEIVRIILDAGGVE